MKPMRNVKLEADLEATRIKLFELTKDMTSEEQVIFFNKKGSEILIRYGLKTKISEGVPIQRHIRV